MNELEAKENLNRLARDFEGVMNDYELGVLTKEKAIKACVEISLERFSGKRDENKMKTSLLTSRKLRKLYAEKFKHSQFVNHSEILNWFIELVERNEVIVDDKPELKKEYFEKSAELFGNIHSSSAANKEFFEWFSNKFVESEKEAYKEAYKEVHEEYKAVLTVPKIGCRTERLLSIRDCLNRIKKLYNKNFQINIKEEE